MKKFFVGLLLSLAAVLFVKTPTPVYALETPVLYGQYQGDGSVKLWWTGVPDSTYQIIYGPKDNPQAHGAVVGSDTSYTVGYLFQNTNYVFSVKAVRGGDVSSLSNMVTVWVGPAGRTSVAVATPTTPQPMPTSTVAVSSPGSFNLQAVTGLETGTVVLSWSEPVESGGYNIVFTNDQSVEKWGVLNLPREMRAFVVRGLTPGQRYWFWMSTTSSGRTTPWVSAVAR